MKHSPETKHLARQLWRELRQREFPRRAEALFRRHHRLMVTGIDERRGTATIDWVRVVHVQPADATAFTGIDRSVRVKIDTTN